MKRPVLGFILAACAVSAALIGAYECSRPANSLAPMMRLVSAPPTRITIKLPGVADGTTYTVACGCVADGTCSRVEQCVTTAGACTAFFDPANPPQPCKWGRDEEGWVSFAVAEIRISDPVRQRAVSR